MTNKPMNDEGLKMKYFILKPRGADEYARASRNAMRAYASTIRKVNQKLAEDLTEWVERETEDMTND